MTRNRDLLAAFIGLVSLVSTAPALTPTDWRNRQKVEVPDGGVVKLVIPAATFDSAQPDLRDLRLIDANGDEVPYLLNRDAGGPRDSSALALRPASFEVSSRQQATVIEIGTGTDQPIDHIQLVTWAPYFLKAAHAEVFEDGIWRSHGTAVPVFRQFGAEHLKIPLNGAKVERVRISIDDARSRSIEFTGAVIAIAPPIEDKPVVVEVPGRIERREEFAGESVLTISLPGKNVPLARLDFDVSGSLFMRRVTVGEREISGGIMRERVIGAGTIFRVAIEGQLERSQFQVPVTMAPAGREVMVHIHNGDSPPLAISAVRVHQQAIELLFHGAQGTYTLLTGNPQAAAPRYDLLAFREELRRGQPVTPSIGGVEATPGYRDASSDAAADGAGGVAGAIDTKAWQVSRPVTIETAGVQELELDLDVLSRARSDFGDVRLVREGNQIPYLVEQTDLSRSIALNLESASDGKRPTVGLWRATLPRPRLPIRRIAMSSSTPLFERHFRIYEALHRGDGSTYESLLAEGDWQRTTGESDSANHVLDFQQPLQGDTFWIETDNGDNAPIVIKEARVIHPVTRLVFRTAATDDVALVYGNREATAPRYDVRLIAGKLLAATRNQASLGAPNATKSSRFTMSGLKEGPLLWAALGLVVIVLLTAVAKLLPKPPAT